MVRSRNIKVVVKKQEIPEGVVGWDSCAFNEHDQEFDSDLSFTSEFRFISSRVPPLHRRNEQWRNHQGSIYVQVNS